MLTRLLRCVPPPCMLALYYHPPDCSHLALTPYTPLGHANYCPFAAGYSSRLSSRMWLGLANGERGNDGV